MEKLNVFNYAVSNSGDRLIVNIDGDIVDATTQQIMRDWWGDETSVSFKSIRDQVNKSGSKNIDFIINSYGGHVGDAMAIHDWIKILKADPTYDITTTGLGFACSAATYILSAGGDQSYISPNSWYMIHNVSGGVWGDVNVIENFAKTMRKFNDSVVDFYAELTGKTTKQISDWMDAETWFTGKEAVEFGFVAKSTENEAKFVNTISAEKFPYTNTAALTLYNSFVRTADNDDDNDENILNLNTDMNKLTTAIVDALAAAGFLPKNAGDKTTPLTTEGMTNALETAFKTVDISNLVNEHLTELFKDGVPEAMQNALTPVLVNSLKGALKDVPTNADLKKIENELDAVKKDVIKNAGQAGKGKKEGGEDNSKEEIGNKFEHVGVDWGTQHLEDGK